MIASSLFLLPSHASYAIEAFRSPCLSREVRPMCNRKFADYISWTIHPSWELPCSHCTAGILIVTCSGTTLFSDRTCVGLLVDLHSSEFRGLAKHCKSWRRVAIRYKVRRIHRDCLMWEYVITSVAKLSFIDLS